MTTVTEQRVRVDEEGNPVVDEHGKPVVNLVQVPKPVPILPSRPNEGVGVDPMKIIVDAFKLGVEIARQSAPHRQVLDRPWR